MSDKKIKNVMWTGGFDSTFRMCQLVKEDIDIQPYYFYNKARKSADIELQKLEEITNALRAKETTKANILPLIVHDVDEYKPFDKKYTDAFKRIRKNEHRGEQYVWMAQMSESIPGLEMSLEAEEGAEEGCFVLQSIPKSSNVIKHDEGTLAYYTLSEDVRPGYEDWYILLSKFAFPYEIAHMTKRECLEKFIDMGDEDIMKMTWFCQLPYKGDACGYCGPCRQVVEEGMEFRLSDEALKRYKHRWWYLLKHKVRKGTRLLFGLEP